LNFDWQYGHSIEPSSFSLDIYELKIDYHIKNLYGHLASRPITNKYIS
jgi:hypothetical protein